MGKAVDQPVAEATRLGSYEILRKLARGGMAELFLARSVGPEGFEKLIVLKKILPNFADNPKFVKLFLDEARLAAGLDHPHIAHVYDMGMVEGNYFFTMEYIHGQDLRRTLRRTARFARLFPLEHAVNIARNVAAALHYAHERRRPDGSLLDIVHRDVSPSNILISYDGAVKLVDFGVAKAANSSVKTRTGTLKGKISYMSPEQAKGSPIDRRSDIFSLGIVLWEMTTTQRLFKADNDLATIQMIVNAEPPAPTKLRPDCSPELERVVLKALAVDVDKRYQNAEEMLVDLEELAREQKLKQSAVALRTHMHHLFADEIQAWNHAKASGITLTDHVVKGSAVDMTLPVSDSDVSYLDEDEDDEEDRNFELPTASPDAPTRQMPVMAMPPPPVIVRHDQTPAPAPIHHPPSGPIPMTPQQLHIDASQSGAMRQEATFPVAPLEWRPPPPQPATAELNLGDRKRKQMIIIGVCAFSAIVLLALVLGGGGNDDNAETPATTPTASATSAAAVVPDLKPEPVEVAPAVPAPAPTPKVEPAAEKPPEPETTTPPVPVMKKQPAIKPHAVPKPAKKPPEKFVALSREYDVFKRQNGARLEREWIDLGNFVQAHGDETEEVSRRIDAFRTRLKAETPKPNRPPPKSDLDSPFPSGS